MRNRLFIAILVLVMAVSMGFIFLGKSYAAKTEPVKVQCSHCDTINHSCCEKGSCENHKGCHEHCLNGCQDCSQCCDSPIKTTVKDNSKAEENCCNK